MQTDDIAAWLTQVWLTDEEWAKQATPGPWRYSSNKHTRLPGTPTFEEGVFAGPPGADATVIAVTGPSGDGQSSVDAAHIAYHDPMATLARIAAERQILALHSPDRPLATEDDDWGDRKCAGCSWPIDVADGSMTWCPTVRLLALPHAARPGYDEAWRP